MHMVSMKDIAKQCNVSVASVSKALNGYPDISEETRQLILNTASFTQEGFGHDVAALFR